MKIHWTRILPAVPIAAVVGVAAYDLTQKKHALLRNFPVVGHLRYLPESIGPELRQYIISGNDEERPFSRNQRRWVYASSKMQNNYFGFGTDSDMEYRQGYPIVKHRTFAKTHPMPVSIATRTPSYRARRSLAVHASAPRHSGRIRW
jgi:glutamate synthase domain-containing protein 2